MHTILQGLGYFIAMATILPIARNINKVNLDNFHIYLAGALGGIVLSSIFIALGASSKAKNDAKVEADRLYIQSGGETKSAANARRVKEIEEKTLKESNNTFVKPLYAGYIPKGTAISIMTTEFTKAGMHEHLAKDMAEKQINGILNSFNKKMPTFSPILIAMALVANIEIMLDEGDEQEKELIGIFQEMLTRHITGLHAVNLDDYDKEILSGIELKIKLNPKLVEAGD